MSSTRRPYLVELPNEHRDVEWFDTEEQAELYAAMVGGLVFRYDSEKHLYIHDKGGWYIYNER